MESGRERMFYDDFVTVEKVLEIFLGIAMVGKFLPRILAEKHR